MGFRVALGFYALAEPFVERWELGPHLTLRAAKEVDHHRAPRPAHTIPAVEERPYVLVELRRLSKPKARGLFARDDKPRAVELHARAREQLIRPEPPRRCHVGPDVQVRVNEPRPG